MAWVETRLHRVMVCTARRQCLVTRKTNGRQSILLWDGDFDMRRRLIPGRAATTRSVLRAGHLKRLFDECRGHEVRDAGGSADVHALCEDLSAMGS